MSATKLICVCCENAIEETEVLCGDPRHFVHSYAAITSNRTWVRFSLVGNCSVSETQETRKPSFFLTIF